MSIYSGTYLVTCIKSLGGNVTFDLVRVVGGSGISSKPWQVLSLITGSNYVVTAMMIVKESYGLNDTIEDAIKVFNITTGRLPDLLEKCKPPTDPPANPY